MVNLGDSTGTAVERARVFDGRGFRLHYEDVGLGETVVFLAGYLMDLHLYDAQVEGLKDHYRCVRLDRRGHGGSDLPPAPWGMDDLIEDAIALITSVDAAPCHLVGMSLGGAEITRIALDRPDLVRSLVYIDAPADPRLPADVVLDIDELERSGVSDDLLQLAAATLFGERFRRTNPEFVAADIERLRRLPTRTVVEGIRLILGATPVAGRLGEIRVPALVLHGVEDVALPFSAAEQLVDRIPNARLVTVEGSGHSSPVEAPEAVTAAIHAFLSNLA